MADILDFPEKRQEDELPANDRDMIMATLGNLMDTQERLEKGMVLATRVIGELQSHVRDLEKAVADLKKHQPRKPVILNATGARAN